MTWNPITGCLHGCAYCYAGRIAKRFDGGGYGTERGMFFAKYRDDAFDPPYVLDSPQYRKTNSDWYEQAAYPFGFEPTFHRYRLHEPKLIKKPQTVFVGSMADILGDWVPGNWIHHVLNACIKAPQHRYLFLTKNPERYIAVDDYLENGNAPHTDDYFDIWFGASAVNKEQLYRAYNSPAEWLSLEPLLEDISDALMRCAMWMSALDKSGHTRWKWIVIGAETGNRKDKVKPNYQWVYSLVKIAERWNTPVFLKNNLIPTAGEQYVKAHQQLPWEAKLNV